MGFVLQQGTKMFWNYMAVMVPHPVNTLKTMFQDAICVVCELYLNRFFFFKPSTVALS